MNNPTLMWHVTMAVHEDRVRALQQSRRRCSRTAGGPFHRAFGFSRRMVCRLQTRPARVSA